MTTANVSDVFQELKVLARCQEQKAYSGVICASKKTGAHPRASAKPNLVVALRDAKFWYLRFQSHTILCLSSRTFPGTFNH
jgi:hypothetical protein